MEEDVEPVGDSSASKMRPPYPRPGARSCLALVIVFGLVGFALRLLPYRHNRSLWLDEAMLSLNVAERSWSELLSPLDYNQAAPLGYLWLAKLSVVLAGVHEQSLRAPAFLAGLLLLVLVGMTAWRLLGPHGAWFAVALAALSPALIRYANEAKPYAIDALATAALVHFTLLVIERPQARGRWLALALIGLVCVLVSFPALFIAGGAAVALLLVDGWAKAPALGFVWLVTALTPYATLYAGVAGSGAQQHGYSFAFLTPGSAFVAGGELALRGTLLPPFLGLGSTIPAVPAWVLIALAGVLILGLFALARRHGRAMLALFLTPPLLALVASALKRYPLGVPRLMLFLAPLLVLLAAAAFAGAFSFMRSACWSLVATALAFLALVPMLVARVEDVLDPFEGEDARSLVAAYRERPRPQEAVYVGARGLPSWVFYTTDWSRPDRERLAFYARAAREGGPSFENGLPRDRPVQDEGAQLVWRHRHRLELLGLYTGRHWSWPSYVKPGPDAGWAANEAERVVRVANPCVWLYFTRLSERANKPLWWVLRDHHGGVRHTERNVRGGILWQICFPAIHEKMKTELAAREAGAREDGERSSRH